MRNIRNVKHAGFTYTKPAIDLLSALNEAPEPRLPAVNHIDCHPAAIIDRDVTAWAKATNPTAVPVFHRWHRQTERPSCLPAGWDHAAS